LLGGSFRHEDFCGHSGVINAGDLQVSYLVPVWCLYVKSFLNLSNI